MSKKNTLPENCEIETLDYDCKDRAFQLRFYAEDNGDDYLSEVYYPGKGQRLTTAAYEVCARYGWLDFPPATGILTKEELEKLDRLVADAIYDMDRNPKRYVPDTDKFWRDIFEWPEDEEFHSEMTVDGDPPIPSPDCDRDDEWTAYNYGQEFTRVMPASAKALSAKKVKGPKGIEILEFHSVDMDGNWDHDATFCRWQKGVKVTKEDLKRHQDNLAAVKASWDAREGLQAGSPEFDAANKVYWAAREACKVTGVFPRAEMYKDNWDSEDFRRYAVQLNCYWTLLRYKCYEIWCAIHGKDPLGNVHCEHKQTSATFDVTTTMVDGVPVTTAKRIKGDPELEGEAIRYGGGYSVAEIKKIIRKNPQGIPLKPERWSYSINHGWKPRKSPRGSVTLRVFMKGTQTLPLTPQRIRQVSCKGLQEGVLRMLHEIDKHYPLCHCPKRNSNDASVNG